MLHTKRTASLLIGRHVDVHVRTIVTNAGSIVGTSSVTVSLGFAFWLVAARRFTPTAVGLGSAAISAMMLLGPVAVFGLGTLLVGELPKHRGRELSLISASTLIAGAVGAAMGLAFALVAPHISPSLRPIGASHPARALFAAGVALTAMSLVFDGASIGLLRGQLQLARNSLFALTKLALLTALAVAAGRDLLPDGLAWAAIFGSWAAGSAVSLAIIVAWLHRSERRISDTASFRPAFEMIRSLGRAALGHHALNLVLQAPVLILPIVVTIALSPAKNAAFYVALNVAGVVFVGPMALSTALFAVGSSAPARLARDLRASLTVGLAAGTIGSAVLLLLSRPLLSVFGQTYAASAHTTLAVLGLAVLPLTVRSHYVTLSRIHARRLRAAALFSAGAGAEVAAAAIGAKAAGLVGLSAGWVAVLTLEALFSARGIRPSLRSAPRAVYEQLEVAAG